MGHHEYVLSICVFFLFVFSVLCSSIQIRKCFFDKHNLTYECHTPSCLRDTVICKFGAAFAQQRSSVAATQRRGGSCQDAEQHSEDEQKRRLLLRMPAVYKTQAPLTFPFLCVLADRKLRLKQIAGAKSRQKIQII